jgi:predicted membrane-bound spermidine synthase
MVPESFTNFFVASAGVSGALIGLLFVAISVSPARTTPLAELQFDLRTAKAFSVFTNALVISLFALIPTIDLGRTAIVVGMVSVISCIAMVLVTVREGPSGSRSTELSHIAVQGAVFIYQIVVGFQVAGTKDDRSGIANLAVLGSERHEPPADGRGLEATSCRRS